MIKDQGQYLWWAKYQKDSKHFLELKPHDLTMLSYQDKIQKIRADLLVAGYLKFQTEFYHPPLSPFVSTDYLWNKLKWQLNWRKFNILRIICKNCILRALFNNCPLMLLLAYALLTWVIWMQHLPFCGFKCTSTL